ncbi:FecR domain-containing protein [Castellaniella hirudinis]|uniref:FecR domain-containing protein n=1 Tax=Castellaniella hirudinis TaxID=1144617 RepID=A0ABV8RWW3_9BURK
MNCSKSVSHQRLPSARRVRQVSDLAWRVLAAWVVLIAGVGMGSVRAEVAARADFVHGLVTATESGQAGRALSKGAEVFDQDRIDTAQGARAQLRFSDGGLVSLLPETTFSVEEYRLGDAGGEDGSLVFGLLRGGLRTVTGAIGKSKHDNYQLKTPVGTLGIRGTEFIAIIDPPGTLRVHVGRGKVVLTNSHGTLEVPEGYNAIMTEDEAPRLTEEGPVFMATGPQGDLRTPVGMVRSDPYNLDLPLMATPKGSPFLQSGPGYFMLAAALDSTYDWIPNTAAGGPGYATFDTGNGALTSFDVPGVIELGMGDATAFSRTDAGLNWGVLTDGSITLPSGVRSYAQGNPNPVARYLPYIIGEVATTAPLTGTLSFSLPAGVTPAAYDNGGQIGALNQFDLGIDVGTNQYTLDMLLTMPSAAFSIAGGTGTLTDPLPVFGFSNTNINGGGCTPTGSCSLGVSGFLTTSGSAGIAYSLNDGNTYTITGVAPLEPPNYTPPATGGGGGGANQGI